MKYPLPIGRGSMYGGGIAGGRKLGTGKLATGGGCVVEKNGSKFPEAGAGSLQQNYSE